MTHQAEVPKEFPALEELIPEQGLALRWQKSCRTLQRWRVSGRGPAWLRIGGSVFYRVADILVFEEASRRGGGDQ